MALDVQQITGTAATAAARLCNFPTGTAALLPAHEKWLETVVRPLVSDNPTAWVDLIGHASRQWRQTHGANRHELNRALSLERCCAAKRRVTAYSPTVRFNVVTAQGDSQSVMSNPDDGYDRAVDVLVYKSGVPPQKKDLPTASASTVFEIRLVGGGSASLGIQADNYIFQIVDRVRCQTAFYYYTGVGLGISIVELALPGSVTKAGPPTRFRTARPVELYQFNSRASLYQDLGVTIGRLNVEGTLRLKIQEITDSAGLVSTLPSIMPIEGGSGIQMPGMSASEGVLAWEGKVYPFTGY